MTKTYHMTVGYAGIAMDMANGNKRFFRCPVECNDTNAAYRSLINNVEGYYSPQPGWDTLSADEHKAIYRAACCSVLGYALKTGNNDQIGGGIEAMHALLGQPVGFVVYMAQLKSGEIHEIKTKVWTKAAYATAKAEVDDFIDMLKIAA